MIVKDKMVDAGADRSEDVETPEFLACSRNIFRDRPSELLTLCRARDAIARTCDIQALTDAGLLHRQPFAFISQSTTEYFYTVVNRTAAATAVQLALSPRHASGPCPSTVWTDTYWVPVGPSTPTATAKELHALETLRCHPTDPLALVDEGTLHHDDAIRLLVGMKTRSWHRPVDTLADVHGLMTMRTQDGYRVSRARREKAFDLHYCRKRSSIELLGGVIHQHFVNIASRLSWALRRLTNHSIDGVRDGQGIWDVDMHETLSTLSYSLLLGLASLATRQGIDTEYLDDDGAANYVSAVTTGHVPNTAGHPPERVCQQLLSCFTVVFHDSEIWRGWTTALPHKGIGYDCMSTAGKWTDAAVGQRADYRMSLSDNNMSLLATGMCSDGVTVDSPQADVIAALRRSASIVVMNTCRPGRCATTVGATSLMAPNRL